MSDGVREPTADAGESDVPTARGTRPTGAGALDAALLGGPRTLTLRDLATRSGVELDLVRLYWRTLGLPHPDADDVAFTCRDAEAVERTMALLRDGRVDRHTMISLTRALGHTSDRLALWQVEAL
ncbi:MAG TPA: adenylate cyclase regulatory domain-containing protein, partial [Cellulomonas sp.]